MNKALLSGLIAVLVIGSTVLFISTRDNDEISTNETNIVEAQDSVVATTPPQAELAETSAPIEAVQAGEYIEFSEQALADTAGTDRVVFFHAEWCSTCKFFENSIKTTGVPSTVTILEVDYDKETEIKDRYGVTIQSTFVLLDSNGEVVKTWPFASGLRSADDLYAAIDAEV